MKSRKEKKIAQMESPFSTSLLGLGGFKGVGHKKRIKMKRFTTMPDEKKNHRQIKTIER